MSLQLKDRETASAEAQALSTTTTKEYVEPPKGILGLWNLRHLIGLMVKRDLLGRYKGSIMGFFWTIINPLGHMLLYIFVFSIILHVQFNGHTGPGAFALYLMAALLPWVAFSESLTRATTCVVEQPNLVKRVVFPLQILPLAVVFSSLLSEAVGIAVLVLVAGIATHTVHATILYLPLILFSQFLFMSGCCWLVSSLGVYLQDLRHMMSLSLSIWMYASPIVYPAEQFPAKLQFLIWLNPIAGIVTDYRNVVLDGHSPNWPMYAAYTTIGAVVFAVGYYFFSKTKRSFADVV
jgi:lipopolysaccharide transport system permease protein